MRVRVPLIAGEKTSPLGRVLVAADSGNGVSNVLDFDAYVFVSPDLSVHPHRRPAGEWVRLDARTTVGDAGPGLAETALHDERVPWAAASRACSSRPGADRRPRATAPVRRRPGAGGAPALWASATGMTCWKRGSWSATGESTAA